MATRRQLTQSPEADKRKMIEWHEFERLIDILKSIKNNSEMTDFIKFLLAPRESRDLSRRLAIAKMLQKGLTYQEIRFQLDNVGIATIAKVSQKMNRNKKQIRNILSKN